MSWCCWSVGFFKAVCNCGSWYLVPGPCKHVHGFKNFKFGNALLLSEAVVMWRTKMVQYFAFKLRITPWYIGWVMKVVYFVRKKTLLAFRCSIYECAGQSSMIITTFYHSWWNLLSNSYRHSSNSSPLIQLFAYAWYRHGKCLIPEKHLSFLDLPITNCSYSTQS